MNTSELLDAIQSAELTYRNVARHDYDAWSKDVAIWTGGGKVGDRPDYADFKLDTPIVKDVIDDNEERGYDEFLEMLEASGEYGVDVPEFGTAYFVDSHGGEGQGDQYWYVFKLIEHRDNVVGAGTPQARHFKVDGYYASYSGGYYDEMYEVFPKQVMITEWTN